MIKVYIIDDHQMIIEGIYSLLQRESDIEWMGGCKLPADLMNFLAHFQPDVLLMDINLPQQSGLELCSEVKAKYPGINIIGISTTNDASIIRRMQENGASGYLLKDASQQEIVTAIHEVNKGRDYVSFSVAESLKKNPGNEPLARLTKREKEILKLIAEGLTNQEIATVLFLNVNTVDTHRKNMLTKFGAKNTAALIMIAVNNHLI
jgi:DNA-binding NarL/FixJ family response regulator